MIKFTVIYNNNICLIQKFSKKKKKFVGFKKKEKKKPFKINLKIGF